MLARPCCFDSFYKYSIGQRVVPYENYAQELRHLLGECSKNIRLQAYHDYVGALDSAENEERYYHRHHHHTEAKNPSSWELIGHVLAEPRINRHNFWLRSGPFLF